MSAEILADLINTTPGEEDKWFATAKELKLFDRALERTNRSPWDPTTLTRTSCDYVDSAPGFTPGAAMAALRWLSDGRGYEVTSIDVVDTLDRVMDAATRLNKADEVSERIRLIVKVSHITGKQNAARQYVHQALQGRMRDHADHNFPGGEILLRIFGAGYFSWYGE